MQRLSNLATVLRHYAATGVASSIINRQELFCSSGLRGFSNSVVSHINKEQNGGHIHHKELQQRRILHPFIYSPSTPEPAWRPLGEELPKRRSLNHGAVLKIVSWNIDFMCPGQAHRTSSAMSYLKERFGDVPHLVVIMLQEMTRESLRAILAHGWIRDHFTVCEIEAPGRYFTLLMTSRDVPTKNWFRVPLPSKMERDALVVDISASSSSRCDPADGEKLIRLCTTHLESLYEAEGQELRPLQLAQISALLREPLTAGSEIVGGLVGGDMNAISKLDASCHKAAHINLRDIWEETNTSTEPAPKLKPFQKDLTYGRARGYTWGKQSRSSKGGKRFDKFFSAGSIDAVPISEAEDHSGKVGRLGIGLTAKIKVWEREVLNTVIRTDDWRMGSSQKEVDAWVSDHYGIAIGIRLP